MCTRSRGYGVRRKSNMAVVRGGEVRAKSARLGGGRYKGEKAA